MSAALKKATSEVDKVTKALENATKKGKKAKQGDEDLDMKGITALVSNLKTALEQLVLYVGKEENFCPKVKEQEVKIRNLEDQNDDQQQKSMIGSFIITSKAAALLATSKHYWDFGFCFVSIEIDQNLDNYSVSYINHYSGRQFTALFL